jgi:hypothetical protein
VISFRVRNLNKIRALMTSTRFPEVKLGVSCAGTEENTQWFWEDQENRAGAIRQSLPALLLCVGFRASTQQNRQKGSRLVE